jgi:hypothetical protein
MSPTQKSHERRRWAPGVPPDWRGDRREARRSVAPLWLDPILSLAEVVDRRRRHIRPIRRDGLLGLELGRHRGRSVRLADGTIVLPGVPVGYLHLRNDRVEALSTRGWQLAGYREARADLAALTRWWEREPMDERPVAFTATTILGPFAKREGWEVRPRLRTWRARLDAWWMSWLLVRFSLDGRERLTRLHHRLDSAEVWLSALELAARYGRERPVSE